MPVTKLNPYLNFNGNAEKAIALYESALGATHGEIMRFGDAPGMGLDSEHRDRVMHVVLKIGEGFVMVTDGAPNMPVAQEGNVHVSLEFEDASDMTKKFSALAMGGKVTLPLQDTFWGAKFGMLTDRFGIQWMFNCENRKN